MFLILPAVRAQEGKSPAHAKEFRVQVAMFDQDHRHHALSPQNDCR